MTSSAAVVLLVEDDRNLLEMVSGVLGVAGFQVRTARDAEAALDLWKELGPADILVTDVVMPGRSGIELASELVALKPGLPVVFMSGLPGYGACGMLELPASAVLVPKPFSSAVLVETVRARIAAAPRALRVLLVDDERALAVPMSRYFQKLGCTTDVAAEAEEAAALAVHNHYDVAILDLRLSPWGGAEGLLVVDEVRRSNRGAAIVVLSAHADEEAEREARRRGADAVLRKPHPLPSLARIVFQIHGGAVA